MTQLLAESPERSQEIFISYAREDATQVSVFATELGRQGIRVWRDTNDLQAGEVWSNAVNRAISRADLIVFALTPDSALSGPCRKELTSAQEMGKLVITLRLANVPDDQMPKSLSEQLSDRQWILVDNTKDLSSAAISIEQVLRTNFDALSQHARIAAATNEWKAGKRRDLFLRGISLRDAERWIDSPRETLPLASKEQRSFISRSRRAVTDQRAIALGTAIALLLIAGIGVQQYISTGNSHRLQSAAARLATQARGLSTQAGADELGLLLAMASDDLAQEAGDTTSVLNDLAQDDDTLVKVVRPKQGEPRMAAMSQDGAEVIMASDVGGVEILDARDGQVAWEHDYPPGMDLAPDQIRVSAVAMSPAGDVAAYTATDLTVHMLTKNGATWVDKQAKLPVSDAKGPLRDPINSLDILTPVGARSFLGFGPNSGLFWFDAGLGTAPVRCAAPPDAVAVHVDVDASKALVVSPSQVISISASGCLARAIFAAPEGMSLVDAARADDGTLTVVATRGADLLTTATASELAVDLSDPFEVAKGATAALSGNAPREAKNRPDLRVVTTAGPYLKVALTGDPDRAQVALQDSHSTMIWDLGSSSVVQRFDQIGRVVDNGQNLLWLHGGEIEIRDRDRATGLLQSYPFPDAADVYWAGADLVVRRLRAVSKISDAADLNTQPHVENLAGSTGAYALSFATDPNTASAAAVYYVQAPAILGVRVWNTATTTIDDIPRDLSRSATALQFVSGDLYVGYREGIIARFRQEPKGVWREVGRVPVGGFVSSLSGSSDGKNLYALAGDPTTGTRVTKIDTLAMTVDSTRELAGASISEGRGALQLTNGEIAIAHGDGIIDFLDPSSLITLTQFHDPELQAPLNLAEISGRNEVVVGARASSIVLDENTHAPVEKAWQRAGPIQSASVNASGTRLATVNFLAGKIMIWNLKADLRSQVCTAIGRDLTSDEWRRFVGDTLPFHPVCTASQRGLSADVAHPGVPVGLTAHRSNRSGSLYVDVRWGRPLTGPAVNSYEVTVSGQGYSGIQTVTDTNYLDGTGTESVTNYCSPIVTYSVRAVDGNGARGDPAAVTIDDPVDCTPNTVVASAVADPDGSLAVQVDCQLPGRSPAVDSPITLRVNGVVKDEETQRCRHSGSGHDLHNFSVTGLKRGATYAVTSQTTSFTGTKTSPAVSVQVR